MGTMRLELLTRDARDLRYHARTLLALARNVPEPIRQSLRSDARKVMRIVLDKEDRAIHEETRNPDEQAMEVGDGV